MDEIIKLQDEILSYLHNNITREEAYYILTTDKDMIEVLISDKKDGSKRIKILDMEYTIERDDMLLLFDTDGIIDECLLTSSHIGINMYFRRQDIRDILSKKLEVMEYRYIKIQVDNIPVVEKRRVILDLTGHRVDRNDRDKIDFMFVYYMARLWV